MTEEIMEEEEMSTTTTTTTLLPQDILMEILSWLPAKSLISSFKFVCKDWCTIIKDPDFVKMHLNRGGASINGDGERSRSNNESLVRKYRSGNTIFQLHPPFNYEVEAKKMDIDSNLLILKSRLVGSCNGLLCLSVNEFQDESIVLLNPSTRKYKVSPEELIQCPCGYRLFQCSCGFRPRLATYGFGCYYNSITAIDEYKVVRIGCFYHFGNPMSFKYQIDIYSVSSNSWRRWRRDEEGIPCGFFQEGSGVFVNGAFHWVMSSKLQYSYAGWDSIDTIVSFNIRDEEFRQVPIPPCVDVVVNDNGVEYPRLIIKTVLMNVRGCLGKVYSSRTKMLDIELEIWVMKEYGIGESWTKEFVIRTSDSDPLRELPAGLCMFRMYMSCFVTGDTIVIELRVGAGSKDYGRRVLYDMNKKEIDGDFRMFDMPYEHWRDIDQVDYIETLVSLKSSNNSKRKDTKSLRNQPFEDIFYFKQQLEGIIYF